MEVVYSIIELSIEDAAKEPIIILERFQQVSFLSSQTRYLSVFQFLIASTALDLLPVLVCFYYLQQLPIYLTLLATFFLQL